LNIERFKKVDGVSARKKTYHTKLSLYDEVPQFCGFAAIGQAAMIGTCERIGRKG
jgi:hypothetical protein